MWKDCLNKYGAYQDPDTEIEIGNIWEISTNDKMEQITMMDMNENLNLFRIETNMNFERMFRKYDTMAEWLFVAAAEIEERRKEFEKRMDKLDDNIEELLKDLKMVTKLQDHNKIVEDEK